MILLSTVLWMTDLVWSYFDKICHILFFFSLVYGNYLIRLDTAVLDLVADDSQGMQKQKSVYHWDKVLETFKSCCYGIVLYEWFFFFIHECTWWQRSKKYIKLNNGERVTASGKVLLWPPIFTSTMRSLILL